MIYKLYKTQSKVDAAVGTFDNGNQVSFLFDSANTDYQQFKQAINDGKAELQDADGNIMSAQDAKQFVSTLP